MASIDGEDMLLVPNPHGMTGALIPLSILHAVIDRIEGSETMLVLDEGLIEFTEGGSPVDWAAQSRNVVILRSFSLYHGLAGLRLGYVVGRASLLDPLAGAARPGPVNTVAAAAAIIPFGTKVSGKDKRVHQGREGIPHREAQADRGGRSDRHALRPCPCQASNACDLKSP